PAVPSTTVPPGLSAPRSTASWMIKSAARSFTDWPGFINSALPRMVQPVSSEARLSLMRGVRPTAAATPLAKGKADLLRALCKPDCAGDNVKSGVKPRKGMLDATRGLNRDLMAKLILPAMQSHGARARHR